MYYEEDLDVYIISSTMSMIYKIRILKPVLIMSNVYNIIAVFCIVKYFLSVLYISQPLSAWWCILPFCFGAV